LIVTTTTPFTHGIRFEVAQDVLGALLAHRAVAAVFGKYTTNAIGDSSILSDPVSKGVASAVAGGVGSMTAGGKFENEAVTAAYGYLFNAMMSDDGWDSKNGRGPNMRGRDAEDIARAQLES